MKIIFLHSSHVEFDGSSLKHKPLGGTETALIGMSRALAKIEGNEIFVFTNMPQPAIYDGVHYYPVSQLAKWAQGQEIDVLVSIRQWVPFWLPLQAKLRIYFSPDAYDQPFLKRAFDVLVTVKGKDLILPALDVKMFFENIDAFFCVGKWQLKSFVDQLGFPGEKMFVTGNGVFLENFQPKTLAERKPRLLYSSTPFRGLEYLIHYFPEIKKLHPAVELEVCSGMGVYGLDSASDRQSYGTFYDALAQLGAISHGSILQRDLAKILCAGRIFTYPNTFAETFCISVLEAQAAGLPVVTSKRAALMERITHGVDGFLIDGEPHQESYIKAFVEATLALLSQPELWQKMSLASQSKAKSFTYENLAAQWQDYFADHLANGTYSLPKIPVMGDLFLNHPDISEKIKIDTPTLKHFIGQVFQQYGFV